MNERERSVTHMSYLEAHKIFYDYINSIVQCGEREKAPGYRKSVFKNTKEQIILAYKVFMAVAYRYGKSAGYTGKEIEEFNNIIKAIVIPWVDDNVIAEYLECEKILKNNSLWGRLKNKSAIPYVKEKRERLAKEIMKNQDIDIMGFLKEQDEFIEAILALGDLSVKRTNGLSSDPQARRKQLTDITNDYCWSAYDIIGLEVRQEDINCFWPLPFLFQLSSHPETEKLFTEEQKKYIVKNQTG